MNHISKTIGLILTSIALVGCNSKASTPTFFGDFGYKNNFLTEKAVKQINVEEAKELIDISNSTNNNRRMPSRTTENIEIVLSKYACLEATVKYYVSDKEEQQVRKELYQGTDFKFLLETNHYEPFGQMSVKYLFVDDDLLDDMERQNEEFKSSSIKYISPFSEPYTYHEDAKGSLIVQTHHFAELPASVGGGIGSTFRQDCELLFDEEGKILSWQSSLGLYTSTPTGTVKQGYIFEVDFEWITK